MAASEKRKLLVLTSTFPRWKDDKNPPFVYQLCKRLLSEYSVWVLAPHYPGTETDETVDGIRVSRFRYFFSSWQRLAYDGGILAGLKRNFLNYGLIPLFLIGECIALVNMLRKYRFHLIHAHWLVPQGLIAVIVRKIVGVKTPLLCTSHGGDLYGLKNRIMRGVKRKIIKGADALTVVSQGMLDEVAGLGADSNSVKVIPMGVDLRNSFVPGKKRADSEQILFVGRLVEKKGVRYLIEALPMIQKRFPRAHLKIAGEGPEFEQLQSICRRTGVSEKVDFLGGIPNESLPALYQEADVVVFPSVIAEGGDREGFGLVLAEALGCECAVVTTDLPAMRDIVSDGQTGLVVPERNAGQIAEKVIFLFENSDLRKKLGKNGRRFVLERFDWTVIGEKYRSVMEAISRVEHSSK